MTTILMHQSQLIADRRKVVNGHHSGLIGVRDEAKIFQTPYCVYGITGFEFFDALSQDRQTEISQQIATVFVFDYFAGEAILKSELCESIGPVEFVDFLKFRTRCRQLRDIHGQYLARKLKQEDQQFIAMNREVAHVCRFGAFHTHSVEDQVVLGAGRQTADILLDHGLDYGDIYRTLRVSGVPTGDRYDVLSPQDLPVLFPPVYSETFIELLYVTMEELIDDDVKRELASREEHRATRKHLTEVIAVFLSMCKPGNTPAGEQAVFDPAMRFDFVTGAGRDTVYWQSACDITGWREDPEDTPEENEGVKA